MTHHLAAVRSRIGISVLCLATATGGCNDTANVAPAGGTTATAATTGDTTATAAAADSELAKLPTPPGTRPMFVNADVAMYITDVTPEAATTDIRTRLLKEGWTPYGGAGDSNYYKRGLERANATVSVSPAQEGKTVISYTMEKLPVDLPAMSEAEQLQFSGTTKQLHFETKQTVDDICKYYVATLEETGWRPTTDRPIKSGVRDELIFRNPGKDMLTLGISEYKEMRRVSLRHHSAEEVAAEEKKFREELARKKELENRPLPKIAVTIPAAAQKLTKLQGRISFTLVPGAAKPYVEQLRKELTAAGWKERITTYEPIAGLIAFTKADDEQTITINFTDPGIVPADVTLLTSGVEIDASAGK